MIKVLALILLLASCSSNEKQKTVAESNSACTTNKLIDKHVRIYSEYNISSLKNCLVNYIKLNPKKSLSVQTCNALTLDRRGKVIAANVYGRDLPTDLKWCVEQAFWKADFALLQIKSKTFVKFPLSFEYK